MQHSKKKQSSFDQMEPKFTARSCIVHASWTMNLFMVRPYWFHSCSNVNAFFPIVISLSQWVCEGLINSQHLWMQFTRSLHTTCGLCLSNRGEQPDVVWTCIEAFNTDPTERRDELNEKQTLLLNDVWLYEHTTYGTRSK